jgi:hypothetical protein
MVSWDGGYRRWASLTGWWILQHQQAAVRGVSGGDVSPGKRSAQRIIPCITDTVLYYHYALLYLYASIHIIHIYPKASITVLVRGTPISPSPPHPNPAVASPVRLSYRICDHTHHRIPIPAIPHLAP